VTAGFPQEMHFPSQARAADAPQPATLQADETLSREEARVVEGELAADPEARRQVRDLGKVSNRA